MSSVKYTSLINNGYRYQEIASNHILLTSSTGYSSIAPDVDGAVLMSTGDGWNMSTDIATDTELSAYSNSLKIYIDTYTSDSELKDYSNSAAATYATQNSLTAVENNLTTFSNSANTTFYKVADFNTYSTSAAATYVTSDKLQVFSESADITYLKETTFTDTISNYYTKTESDDNLENYSNQVSIALQNLNGNFNNYYDKTHFDLVIEAYSNNADLVYLKKADATNTYATIVNLNAVDTKLTTFSTSAAATYATNNDLTTVENTLTTFSNSANTTFYKVADFNTYSTSAAATYATQDSLTAVDNNFNNYYTKTEINNTLDDYSTSSEIAGYYYNKSQINTSIATCVQTTDYNSDLSSKIYTTTGLTSSSILIYQNGKSTINLPTTNGNYMLNKNNNTYSFTEYIGNNYEANIITYPSEQFSLLSTNQAYSTFITKYPGNYLIAGTIDIYIDDITLLTPPEDSELLDYDWIDALPIINISVGGNLTFQYVVKQNQPLQTIPINIVYLAHSGAVVTALSINCQVTDNPGGPTLQPSNIFVRPSKYNNNLRIVKM